ALRDHGVLDSPQRLESQRLRGLGQFERPGGTGGAAGVGERQAELHGRTIPACRELLSVGAATRTTARRARLPPTGPLRSRAADRRRLPPTRCPTPRCRRGCRTVPAPRQRAPSCAVRAAPVATASCR